MKNTVAYILRLRRYALFGVLLVIWFMVAELSIVHPAFLPKPQDVILALFRSIASGGIIFDVGISCYRVFVGFLVAFVVAIPLGVVVGISGTVRNYVEPFNEFFRYVPVPAIIPLLILWLGIGNPTQIAIIAFGTMPQLVVLVADAVRQMPTVYRELSEVHHLQKLQHLLHVVIPYTAPHIYDSARVTIGWAWSYLLVAEIIAADRGIGQGIIVAQRFLRTDQVMVGILLIAILGLIVDRLLRLCYPHIFPWAENSRRKRDQTNALSS